MRDDLVKDVPQRANTRNPYSVLGTAMAWHLRNQSKNSDLLAANRTQKGIYALGACLPCVL